MGKVEIQGFVVMVEQQQFPNKEQDKAIVHVAGGTKLVFSYPQDIFIKEKFNGKRVRVTIEELPEEAVKR